MESRFGDAVFIAVLLKRGPQEFDDHLADFPYLVRIRLNLKTLLGRIEAGSHKPALPVLLDFDHTHAAGAEWLQAVVVTERRDLDACCLCRLQQSGSAGSLNRLAIDF